MKKPFVYKRCPTTYSLHHIALNYNLINSISTVHVDSPTHSHSVITHILVLLLNPFLLQLRIKSTLLSVYVEMLRRGLYHIVMGVIVTLNFELLIIINSKQIS